MDKLYIINQDIYGDSQVYLDYKGLISGIYTDLEYAKKALQTVYQKTSDYHFYEYKITVYQLEGTEYKMTHHYYTYTFDKFTEFVPAKVKPNN